MNEAGDDDFGKLGLRPEELLAWLRRATDEHAIMAVTDAKGVIVHVNERFCRITGYTPEELIGQTHRIIRSEEHDAAFFAGMWGTITSGKTWHGTICNRAKDGSHYWVESTIQPLLDAAGQPRFYLALRTEVTQLKETEVELREGQRQLADQVELLRAMQGQLAAFWDHASIGISWREITQDGQPGANHVNQRFCEIIGLTEDEALDIANVARITHPDDLVVQQQLTDELYSGQRDEFQIEKRYRRPDGKEVWGNLKIVVLRDGNGRVTHHFGMLEDVTARHQAVWELEQKEERWRTYLDTASEILYAITPEGFIKYVSSAWTRRLGHSVKVAEKTPFTDYVHPDHVDAWNTYFQAVLAGETGLPFLEYRVRHADGRWIWHAISGSVYTDRDKRRAFLGVGRDITARREAQEGMRLALARREEMERIVNRSPSVVVLWRAAENWPVEFVSASVGQYGYTPEYFTDSNQGFIAITHPDDAARVSAEVQAHATAAHDEYTQEYRIVCADGSVRWVDDHTVVRRDAEGHVTHHEGLITDITERKAAEEREREIRERDLRTAAEFQAALCPRVFPDISAVEIEALSDPSMLIGGDYYDVVPVDDHRWGFVIADVSGKGAGAALVMTEARATLRLCAEGETSPAKVLQNVNRTLQPDMRPGMFVGMFYGIFDLDTKVLRYCRAGHEPPLLLRADSETIDQLPGTGMAIGLDDGTFFNELLEECEVTLRKGDLLALYTDGITEALNPAGEEFGRHRLGQALRRDITRPLAEVVRTVDRYVRNFCVLEERHDDRTLLLVRAN